MLEHRLITAPDLDDTNCFKIMLVDFDWDAIEALSETFAKVPELLTVYLYGSNESDHSWAIRAAQCSDAILINLHNRGNIELLKGHLLSMQHAEAFGSTDQGLFARKTVYDIHEWLTRQLSRQNRNFPTDR